MAKRRTRSGGNSPQDLLLKEAQTAISRVADARVSGVLTDTQFLRQVDAIEDAVGGQLDKARSGRLSLAAIEARGKASSATVRPSAVPLRGGGPLALRQPNRVLEDARTRIPADIRDRATAQRINDARRPASALPIELQQTAAARPQNILRDQMRIGAKQARGAAQRLGTARPRIIQNIGDVEIPSIFGGPSSAAVNPAVMKDVARIESAASPKSVASAGRRALGTAKAAQAKGLGRQKLGRGAKGALGAGVMAMLASSIFGGKKDEIDPQVAMALAQQMGGGAAGSQGPNSSRTLTDVGKLLSIIKAIQSMAGQQGQEMRPRLI